MKSSVQFKENEQTLEITTVVPVERVMERVYKILLLGYEWVYERFKKIRIPAGIAAFLHMIWMGNIFVLICRSSAGILSGRAIFYGFDIILTFMMGIILISRKIGCHFMSFIRMNFKIKKDLVKALTEKNPQKTAIQYIKFLPEKVVKSSYFDPLCQKEPFQIQHEQYLKAVTDGQTVVMAARKEKITGRRLRLKMDYGICLEKQDYTEKEWETLLEGLKKLNYLRPKR